jgi:hypothetical protein
MDEKFLNRFLIGSMFFNVGSQFCRLFRLEYA